MITQIAMTSNISARIHVICHVIDNANPHHLCDTMCPTKYPTKCPTKCLPECPTKYLPECPTKYLPECPICPQIHGTPNQHHHMHHANQCHLYHAHQHPANPLVNRLVNPHPLPLSLPNHRAYMSPRLANIQPNPRLRAIERMIWSTMIHKQPYRVTKWH